MIRAGGPVVKQLRSAETMANAVIVPVTELDEEGRGVGRTAAGLEVHVAGALPGETVRVALEHESPHAPRAWATLASPADLVGPAAPERVTPACPAHGRCGGCVLQHLAYPAQLTEKRRLVERALAAHPGLTEAAELVTDVVASPRELEYRNKAKYVVAAGPDGRPVYGSYAPRTHDVVDMRGCRVPELPIDAVADAALRLCDAERIPAYDERARSGELRHLIVRANGDGEVLVVIVVRTTGPLPALRRAARALRGARREVAGVVANVNPTTGAAIFGAEDHLLDGASALVDTVGEVRLELSARAFFQVNRLQAARLYAEAATEAHAIRGARAVDLYTGVGGIALTMGLRGAQVVGIEAHAAAVADAARSADRLGLAARVRFEVGDAAAALPAAKRLLGELDAVVVNPPRKGLTPATRTAILEAAPARLVYVSCNPETLAIDLASFSARGWRVERVVPFDLMPGTPHVETLATVTPAARSRRRSRSRPPPGRRTPT